MTRISKWGAAIIGGTMLITLLPAESSEAGRLFGRRGCGSHGGYSSSGGHGSFGGWRQNGCSSHGGYSNGCGSHGGYSNGGGSHGGYAASNGCGSHGGYSNGSAPHEVQYREGEVIQETYQQPQSADPQLENEAPAAPEAPEAPAAPPSPPADAATHPAPTEET